MELTPAAEGYGQPPPAPTEAHASTAMEGSHANCQVCAADLSTLKTYFKRYRICLQHCTTQVRMLQGQPHRWCQQCGRFEPTEQFLGNRKTCEHKLRQKQRQRSTLRQQQRAAAAALKAGARKLVQPRGIVRPAVQPGATLQPVRLRPAGADAHSHVQRTGSVPAALRQLQPLRLAAEGGRSASMPQLQPAPYWQARPSPGWVQPQHGSSTAQGQPPSGPEAELSRLGSESSMPQLVRKQREPAPPPGLRPPGLDAAALCRGGSAAAVKALPDHLVLPLVEELLREGSGLDCLEWAMLPL